MSFNYGSYASSEHFHFHYENDKGKNDFDIYIASMTGSVTCTAEGKRTKEIKKIEHRIEQIVREKLLKGEKTDKILRGLGASSITKIESPRTETPSPSSRSSSSEGDSKETSYASSVSEEQPSPKSISSSDSESDTKIISDTLSLSPKRIKGKIPPPSSRDVQEVFSLVAQGQLDIPQEKLSTLKQGVTPQRELFGFDTLQLQAQQLGKCRKMNPKEIDKHMRAQGYEPVKCKVINENGKEANVTFYKKDAPVLLHGMETRLFNSIIMPKIDSKNRNEDKGWIFNYQDKLCTSLVNSEESFYHSDRSIGLVLSGKPEFILEIFAHDCLSPVGFRLDTDKTREPEEVERERNAVARVGKYIRFQEIYNILIAYCDSITQQCISVLLESPKVNDAIRKEAYAIRASYDELSRNIALNPIEGEFLTTSQLTQKLMRLWKFVEKYKGIIDEPGNYQTVFSREKGDSSILAEVGDLVHHAQKIDKNKNIYKDFIMHAKAGEIGPKMGHTHVERGTTAYLSGNMSGVTKLKQKKEEPHKYSEINVGIQKKEGTTLYQEDSIDIVAFKVDPNNFESSREGFSIDVPAEKEKLAEYEQELKKLGGKKDEELDAKIAKVKALIDMAGIIQTASDKSIPILL